MQRSITGLFQWPSYDCVIFIYTQIPKFITGTELFEEITNVVVDQLNSHAHTLKLVQHTLNHSGIPENETNVAIISSSLVWLKDKWTYFEMVMWVF